MLRIPLGLVLCACGIQAQSGHRTPATASTPLPAGIPLVSIDCGGPGFTASDGTVWSADENFSGGDPFQINALIIGTRDLALYRSARHGVSGDFSYSIPAANGSYVLFLRFAELEFRARGQRVFKVLANGQIVLGNFDILSEVPPLTVDNKQIPVTVTNGILQIDVQGVVGYGILNGIQIFPGGGSAAATPPPQSVLPKPGFGGNSSNTDQWAPNPNPPQSVVRNGGEILYNGIQLPAAWPPVSGPTQVYQVPPYLVNPPAVIPIDVGRQLFVDDFLIAQTNLTRVQHQPTFYSGNPVIAPGTQGQDNNNLALVYSDGVWYDPADGLFKMWYDGGNGNDLCYAFSSDGLNWTKPRLSDAPLANTNMVLQLGGARDSVTVWMDLHDDPSRKFKLFAYFPNNSDSLLGIYYSPDGIHWSDRQPYTPNSLSDRTTVFWNPFRNVWVDSARSSATLPPSPSRGAAEVRSRFYSESPDLLNWNPINLQDSFWTSRDDRDPPYPGSTTPPELYNLDATPYESLLVGLFSWYYPPDGPDLVELGVGFSRDGFNWSRPTRGAGPSNALIPASNQPGTWNGYNTQSAGGGFLVMGDRLYIYFSGRDTPHSQENASTRRSTGVAFLRRDGFYSMDAGAGAGILTTRPVRFNGSHLFVNVADPTGQLQVEVLDALGNVIPQFSRSASSVVSTDTTKQEVTWSGASLGALAGRPVQFRFYLSNGELYSFWVTSSASGASNGYVAAGGPGFTSDVDR